MLQAYEDAIQRRRGIYARRERQYWAFYTGIMRRYIRLQQENARLRDEVAFWKAEALKDGDDE